MQILDAKKKQVDTLHTSIGLVGKIDPLYKLHVEIFARKDYVMARIQSFPFSGFRHKLTGNVCHYEIFIKAFAQLLTLF